MLGSSHSSETPIFWIQMGYLRVKQAMMMWSFANFCIFTPGEAQKFSEPAALQWLRGQTEVSRKTWLVAQDLGDWEAKMLGKPGFDMIKSLVPIGTQVSYSCYSCYSWPMFIPL